MFLLFFCRRFSFSHSFLLNHEPNNWRGILNHQFFSKFEWRLVEIKPNECGSIIISSTVPFNYVSCLEVHMLPTQSSVFTIAVINKPFRQYLLYTLYLKLRLREGTQANRNEVYGAPVSWRIIINLCSMLRGLSTHLLAYHTSFAYSSKWCVSLFHYRRYEVYCGFAPSVLRTVSTCTITWTHVWTVTYVILSYYPP